MNTITEHIKKLLHTTTFLAFRWETPDATPSTGITAVMRGEKRAFHRRGVFLAPWERKMKQAQDALKAGKVRDSGASFSISGWPFHGDLVVRILLAETPSQAPVIYLAPENLGGNEDLKFFAGVESPYDTPFLKQDAVFFARLVDRLTQLAEMPTTAFIWSADWETVPGMVAMHHRGHVVALHAHNCYDEFLGAELADGAFPGAELFHHQTVLKTGLSLANVAVTVNRGYCWGLRHEVLYTRLMAAHLQPDLTKLNFIDNAPFVELTPELRRLEEDIATDYVKGFTLLEELKHDARMALPVAIQEKAKNKVLFVSMGRRVSQKGHDVLIEAVRSLLRHEPKLPALFFFATTHGDTASVVRQKRIEELANEFPDNVVYFDGHLPYYNKLMEAADFNVMPSLGEPHGGAFQGYVIPIARAIDGLAAQICAYQPVGLAAKLNTLWHPQGTLPSGLTFREPALPDENQLASELNEFLINATPSSTNQTFQLMASALAETLLQAVRIKQDEPNVLAQLAQGALRAQMARSWEMNLGAMLALVDAARR